MLKKNRLNILFVTAILLIGFAARLYRFDSPVADWHSWRQADTSAVSRNFVASGFDLLHPKFDDLSNVPSGFDNPEGYRFVEFPIYNTFQAGFYVLFKTFTLEQWGRLLSIFASLISVLFLYLLVKKHADTLTALISPFFLAALPFSVYYGRVILPDFSMVAAILAATYFLDLFLDAKVKSKQIIFFLLSLIFAALALLFKPYALFFTLPMLFLVFVKFKLTAFRKWYLWLFLTVSLVPLILWRLWMLNFPQGIPASGWLFNGGNIRFTGAFFYWLFAERVGRLILGYWGIALLIIGFLKHLPKKNFYFFLSFLISSLIYLFTIARGNVQHDYYQILIIPSIAIYLGLGSSFLLSYKDVSKTITRLLFLVIVAFSLSFSWFFIRDYFNVLNGSIIEAGAAVDKLTPKDAKVIASYNGDTSFLYQTKRKGWASMEKPLPEMIKMGASYLILVNPTEADLNLDKEYKIVYVNKNYVIFDLLKKQ